MFSIRRYTTTDKEIWDKFVQNAKNAVFLFERNFMDYHSDRFADHSLLFFKNDALLALLPANEEDDKLISHSGLTYGGWLLPRNFHSKDILDIFDILLDYLQKNNFNKLVYKSIPHIYHQIPAEEDLYALFKNNAELIARTLSSTVQLPVKDKFATLRQRGIKKAKKWGIHIRKMDDFIVFWKILEKNLSEHHHIAPVHSSDEIILLKNRFPNNIQLYGAFLGEEMLAGIVIFESSNVAHAQYLAASPKGKESGALDLLLAELIINEFSGKKYFDFGISTENEGKILNTGLLSQKEGFAARSVVYDTYLITQ
ncbi:MAG: GNAT family N-acetyltransferase [Bacteroidales bacterium]|jgi:hypothetical protein|nr:GNAT family N-acetyltransferase [Bacteroidales bacterium]